MVKNSVLIVYGSRYGSTEEIVIKISSELQELGILPDLINLKTFDIKSWPNIDDYNAIIIGSSIKMGNWTKEIKKFIELKINSLRNFNGPIGFFVTSGLASDPEKYEELKETYIDNPMEKYNLKILFNEVFAGKLDLTSSSKFSWLDKKIVKAIAKENKRIKMNEKNDFRNWVQISKFAKNFVSNEIT